MTKADLTELVYANSDLAKKEADSAIDAVFEIMKDALISGDNLKISGFGGFALKEKGDRQGRNPQTGETITIAKRRVVTFKPSTTLRQRFNGGADAP